MQFHISAHICLLQSWEQSPSESVTGDSCRVTVQAGADHAAPAASLTIEIAVWMPFSNPQMVRDGEKLGGGWGGDVTRLKIIRLKLWCHYVEASFDAVRTNRD